jgi:hypothetical protein
MLRPLYPRRKSPAYSSDRRLGGPHRQSRRSGKTFSAHTHTEEERKLQGVGAQITGFRVIYLLLWNEVTCAKNVKPSCTKASELEFIHTRGRLVLQSE